MRTLIPYTLNIYIVAATTVSLLSGCATTVPMKITKAPSDRNSDQRQLDNIECSNMSHTEGPLLFGVGVALNRSRSATLYTDCMKAKGYVVVRAPDAGDNANLAKVSPDTATATNALKLSLAFPDGWQQLPLSDQMRMKGTVIFAHNITRDAGVIVAARDARLITDVDVYTQSRMASQLNMLKKPTHSEVQTLTVNGHQAKRFEVAGEASNGQRYKYVDTLIFGTNDVVSVSSYTTEVNYPSQQSDLELLPERIAGLW